MALRFIAFKYWANTSKIDYMLLDKAFNLSIPIMENHKIFFHHGLRSLRRADFHRQKSASAWVNRNETLFDKKKTFLKSSKITFSTIEPQWVKIRLDFFLSLVSPFCCLSLNWINFIIKIHFDNRVIIS